jgi:predicted nucleotidyltransferase
MEKILNNLVGRLTKTYGDRLVSVVLYGSAAVGDHSGRYSDINVFCVLREITPRELGEAEPILRWWRGLDNPSPLLMSEDEVRTSTDCFPIEFHDIKERHRILHGRDVVADLEIDDSFYRAQVEYQLRAKVLRLRQKGAGVMHDKELLLRLLAESLSTFCVLSRHALRLCGAETKWQKREIIEGAREKFGIDTAPFLSLLDLREEKIKPRSLDPASLYEKYLKEIQVVVDAVDRLEK